MENVTETVKSIPKESIGFFKYVFNFDDENKCEMMNMLQYTLLSVIPVMIILKAIKYIVPEDDDSKGSLEILAESIGQLLLIVCAIWFTNKIIHYIPTYSNCEYSKFNATNFMIPLLIILTTMQTKLGAKLNILLDRVLELWYGKDETNDKKEDQSGNVRVSQPISGHQPSQADNLGRSQLLPSNPQPGILPQLQTTQVALQQSPDFNQMYQNQVTPLVNAQEPMAANEGFSAFGGSPW